jgi:hypothetical protein
MYAIGYQVASLDLFITSGNSTAEERRIPSLNDDIDAIRIEK